MEKAAKFYLESTTMKIEGTISFKFIICVILQAIISPILFINYLSLIRISIIRNF